MKTFFLKSLHERAIFYLEQYENCENHINDLKNSYDFQLILPKNDISRFLITPESWYRESIARYEKLLIYIEKRYNINCGKIPNYSYNTGKYNDNLDRKIFRSQ